MRRAVRRDQLSARRAGLRAMLLPWVRRADARRLARVLPLACSCSQRSALPRGYSQGAGGKVRGEREPRCSGILAEIHVWGPEKEKLCVLVNYKSEVFSLVGTQSGRSFITLYLWRFILLDRRRSVLQRPSQSLASTNACSSAGPAAGSLRERAGGRRRSAQRGGGRVRRPRVREAARAAGRVSAGGGGSACKRPQERGGVLGPC